MPAKRLRAMPWLRRLRSARLSPKTVLAKPSFLRRLARPNEETDMLTNERKKQMRAIGHHLKPVVLVGDQGLSPGLLDELNRALNDHELIKVKVRAERDTRKVLVDNLCQETGATCVQTTGAMALLFRAAERPNPRLSNLIRPL